MPDTMATADSLTITVGDHKTRITLTDSAVEAVQAEAAGLADAHFNEIGRVVVCDLAGLDLNELLELRHNVAEALAAVEVLIECRPLDEIDSPPSSEDQT